MLILVGYAATTTGPIDATAWLFTNGGTALPVGTVGMGDIFARAVKGSS